MSPAVTVIGSINLDLLVSVAHLPRTGETVVGLDVATGPGGKGANQAAAAARLSDDVAMVARVGNDADGAMLRDELARRGIDVDQIASVAAPTGHATIAVEVQTAENLIIVAPGANAQLMPADVQVPAVRDADVVLLQLEIPMATVLAAAQTATGRVVLNPAPAAALPAPLLAAIDVLVPNESELARLAGQQPGSRSVEDIVHLARQVGQDTDVVVTLGARGALVVQPVGAWLIAAPAVQAIDTTGAGDCFCGALCVALAGGAELVAAARYAVTAAALSTTGAGARSALPDTAAVAASLSSVGVPVRVA
jgi:ribokinase